MLLLADGLILSEMLNVRQRYVRKEKIRISMGTWNINGDKNPALEDAYPSILNAWILDGPENLSSNTRKGGSIPTIGLSSPEESLSDEFNLSRSRRGQQRLSKIDARHPGHWFSRDL